MKAEQATKAVFSSLCVMVFLGLAALAAAQQGVWRVEVLSGMSEQEAEARVQSLAGIEDVQILPYQGDYGIFIGEYATEAEAREAARQLTENEGVIPQGQAFFPGESLASQDDTEPTGAEDGRYRVLVDSFTTQSAAQSRRTELERQGVFPVDILQRGDFFQVFAGYEYASRSQAENYYQSLREDPSLNTAGFTGVEDLTQPVQTPETDPDQLRQYASWVEEALQQGNLNRAEQLLDEWEEAEPGNVIANELRQDLQERRAEQQSAEAEASRYEEMKTEAQQAEQARNYDESIRLWQEIARLPNVRPEQRLEARQNIERINDVRFEPTGTPVTTDDGQEGGGGMSPGVLIAVLAGGLLLVAGGVFFFLRSRGSKPAPRPAAAGTPSASSLGGLESGGGMALPSASPPTEKEKPAQQKKEQKRAAPTPKKEKRKEKPGPTPATEVDEDDSVSLEMEEVEEAPRTEPESAPAGAEAPSEGEGVAVEEFEPETEKEPEPAPSEPAKAEQEPSGAPRRDSTDQKRIPIMREGSESEETAAEKEAPAATQQQPAPGEQKPEPKQQVLSRPGHVVFYEQNFNEENAGEMPKNWKGSYDYASLSIVDREDEVGGRCMKFDKEKGTGSAYYSCRFPDASGRIAIEFDLRCDHKNKYLLGFYIEKDEDFRQSVHTVVHRDISKADKVTLRVQNEPTAYELGKWVHIRMLIDLPRNMIDGHVNGEAVAMGVRLASRPKVLNTLSIRDNLATEGTLLIDNIRIYQDR